jgi:hypothetical protein
VYATANRQAGGIKILDIQSALGRDGCNLALVRCVGGFLLFSVKKTKKKPRDVMLAAACSLFLDTPTRHQ